jgi:hypothetical protein
MSKPVVAHKKPPTKLGFFEEDDEDNKIEE